MSSRRPLLPLLATLALVAGCRDRITAPEESPSPSPVAPTPPLGVVEVTITGIGTPEMTASARFPGAERGGGRFALVPVPGSDGTIQLALHSTGSFTSGQRGAGGVRYLQTTFRVRNADSSGQPYGTARQNLTFLAASTPQSIGGTAIQAIRRFDGSLITDPSFASQIVPTGPVFLDMQGRIVSSGADALQVLTEAEAASFAAPAGVDGIFPYGFVTRRATTNTTRTLPASPAAEQWDGLVTFAFRVPLQASSAQDAFLVTISFVPVDDTQTRITQSLQEQRPAGTAAFLTRADALGAALRVLPGAAVPGERICSVRSAGTAAAPSAFMVNATATFVSRAPNPYTGAGSFLPTSTAFSATFSAPVTGQGPQSFVVNGSRRGRYFLGGTYANHGAGTIATPSGSFFAGEEVEVVLTNGILGPCDAPSVVRYRIGTNTASTDFTEAGGSPVAVGSIPDGVAPGDFNGDGNLDMAVANSGANSISVLIGNGAGGFTRTDLPTAGCTPGSIVTGDVDGDGDLDLAVANECSGDVEVLLGNGGGGFARVGSPVRVAGGPLAIALGDMNADGALDIVTGNLNFSSGAVTVLLGYGTGQFVEAAESPFSIGVSGVPSVLAIGDLNKDGRLDVAVADQVFQQVVVLLGDGAGGLDDSCGCTAFLGADPQDLDIGDVNNDGNPDAAVISGSGAIILLGDGTGALTTAAGSPVSTGPDPVTGALGDLDGDGDLDLVVGDAANGRVAYLRGSGTGAFTDVLGGEIVAPGVAQPKLQTVDIADFNGDGRLDVVFSADSNEVQLFVNTP